MSEPEKRIAKIKSTFLGYEDHGILTFFLFLDYGGLEQGAGGYVLADEYTDKFVRGVLSACGVDAWEKLSGRTIYAYADRGKVYGIEPLLTEPGKPFMFGDVFDEASELEVARGVVEVARTLVARVGPDNDPLTRILDEAIVSYDAAVKQ